MLHAGFRGARRCCIAIRADVCAPARNAAIAQRPAALGSARGRGAISRARRSRCSTKRNASELTWGILVADRDTGETLYELNADHFFAPASNAKIVTTALALATLGPDYRFRTTLESQAALGQRRTSRRRSDSRRPRRSRSFESQVSLRGQRRTRRPGRKSSRRNGGRSRGQRAEGSRWRHRRGRQLFPYDPYPAGWTTGDLFFAFGAPVSAIAFNDNMISDRCAARAHASAIPRRSPTEPERRVGHVRPRNHHRSARHESRFRGGAPAGREFHAAARHDSARPRADAARLRHDRSRRKRPRSH